MIRPCDIQVTGLTPYVQRSTLIKARAEMPSFLIFPLVFILINIGSTQLTQRNPNRLLTFNPDFDRKTGTRLTAQRERDAFQTRSSQYKVFRISEFFYIASIRYRRPLYEQLWKAHLWP